MQLEARDPKVRDLARLYDAAYLAKRQGRFEDAIATQRALLRGCRDVAGADRYALASACIQQLADVTGGELAADELAFAEETAAATESGDEPGWIVRFALASALTKQDPAAAMTWLDAANAMRRAKIVYNADQMDLMFQALMDTFDGEAIARLSQSGGRSPKPIFVVGLPRSGTTLVEQILASAPGVHGAGELTAIADLARDIHAKEGGWPLGAARLTPGRVTRLATAYLVHLHKLAPKAERVVDKMPGNAQNVGLILSLFPNARILHVRRDALDACFGCYRQLFRGDVSYCYEQTELGRYQRGLERILDHWKQAAPGRIFEVNYESLVRNFEEEARRLVDAAGVEWSDACLNFHETDREIDTASSVQVRRPINAAGIGSSRPFRPYLEPLATALAA